MVESVKVTKGMEQVSSPYRVKKADRQHPDSGQKKFGEQLKEKTKNRKKGLLQDEPDDIVDIHGKPEAAQVNGERKSSDEETTGADSDHHQIDIRI